MQFLTLHFHKVRREFENISLDVTYFPHVTLSNAGTPSLKYSSLRTESLDVVVKRAQNGALNIEIDFDNTLRFTGTQEEVQCYDVVESVEGVEVTFKRSAFTALREVLRSNRRQESFRLQVKRIVEPPPVITNMMAFDRFVLRWNLWRYLPLKTQRRRLEMIRVAFSGEFFSNSLSDIAKRIHTQHSSHTNNKQNTHSQPTGIHPNAVHNRLMLKSTKFVKRMLICITDPSFDISMLTDVLDIVGDFVLCGSATRTDLETIAGYLVSTLMSTFSSSTLDKKNQLVFMCKPERAYKIRVGLLTMLYKLIIGLPARVFQESHDQDLHGTS